METLMTGSPLITVGIPTFNGGPSVRKAVESVLSQHYPHLEILISDNASTDNTPHICHELVRRYSSIRYFRQSKNIGMLPNFNFLLQKAYGKYFLWLADDDVLTPGTLLKYIDFLERHPSYALVSGAVEYRLHGRVSEYEFGFTFQQPFKTLRVVKYYFKVTHGAIFHGLMRTYLAQQIEMRNVIGSDWHFVATLALLGKIRNLEFIGYQKRLGGSSHNFEHYAKLIGDSTFAGKYPHLKIAVDACKEIMSRSAIFQTLSFPKRLLLAVCAFLVVLLGYYVRIYPRVVMGKLRRGILNTIRTRLLTNSRLFARNAGAK